MNDAVILRAIRAWYCGLTYFKFRVGLDLEYCWNIFKYMQDVDGIAAKSLQQTFTGNLGRSSRLDYRSKGELPSPERLRLCCVKIDLAFLIFKIMFVTLRTPCKTPLTARTYFAVAIPSWILPWLDYRLGQNSSQLLTFNHEKTF